MEGIIRQALFIFLRYYLLYFIGGILIVFAVSLVRMLADVVMPDIGDRTFSLVNAVGWEPLLLVILLLSFIIGSRKMYKDFVVAPAKVKHALSQPPLNQLEKHGFKFDGDYFKRIDNNFLVLIAYHWLDYMKPKGNIVVGVLFAYEGMTRQERLEKSKELEEKYLEHDPPFLFYENFAYQLLPVTLKVEEIIDFKDLLLRIVGLEDLPDFSQDQIGLAMEKPVKTVFPELDGLL